MSTSVLPGGGANGHHDTQPSSSNPSAHLTSFGFLPEEGDESEAPFAFGHLFSKVKSAFTSVAAASAPAPEPLPLSAATEQGSATALSSHNTLSTSPESSHLHVRKAGSRNLAQPPAAGSHDPARSIPSRANSTSPSNTRQPSLAASGTSSSQQPPQRSSSSRLGSGAAASSKTSLTSTGTPSLAMSAITSTSSGFPFKLSSTARAAAPAVTSTAAAHAVSARYTTAATADGSSVAGDDGEGDDGDGDVLSALMRKSGVALRRGGPGGHAGAGSAAWSSIPGFPLSRDILADDARSIRSSSSRQPRSELNSEAHIPTSHAAHAHAFGHTERAGLTTSAEAFRRMRGEGGLSKQFWMPDESVTECRGCGSAFTPFRRKHHCRLDGLIYCGRCAPAIVSGRRFGLSDEPVRICSFCMRMLAEYDRAGEGHQLPQRTRNTSLTGSILGASMRQAAAAAVASVSGSSSAATAATPRPDKGMISAPLEAQNRTPQSQFAASHLFSTRTRVVPTSLSMSKVAETSLDSIAVGDSRPASPDRAMTASPAASKAAKKEGGTAAPFRMGLGDEDKAIERAHEEEEEEEAHRRENAAGGELSSNRAPPHRHPAELPTTTAATPGTSASVAATSSGALLAPTALRPPLKSTTSSATDVSSVGFPRTEPSSSRGESPPPKPGRNLTDSRSRLMSEGADVRTRLVSDAARKAFRRSRLRTKTTVGGDEGDLAAREGAMALDGSAAGLPTSPGDEDLLRLLSHSRRPSSYGGLQHQLHHHHGARGPQLGAASLAHLETMLEQCLRSASVPQHDVWKDVLLNLVLTAVKNLKPTDEAGSAMDVRHLVKVKRIPGGSPRDSQHVLGVVVSKNVATKRMAKALPLSSPRILVLAFPIDFYRASGALLSLDRVEKEQEYTRLLVGRIAQLRPNVVIVKDSVSRMAIDMLEDAGITVVWSLKPSAIEAITRACDADVITSVDRLALEPRLGRCLSLSVDTYEHAALPSARKSYMRFLAPFGIRNPGCTIILRGGDTALLGRIKAIVELLVFVAHNLRLEEYLAQDEVVAINELHNTQVLPLLQDEDELWTSILNALRPFENTVLTATATVKVPPPFPLVRLKEDHLRLTELARQTAAAQPAPTQALKTTALEAHSGLLDEKSADTPSAATPSTEVPPAVDSEHGSADATPLAEVPSTRLDQLMGPPPASAVAAPPPTATPDPVDVPTLKKNDKPAPPEDASAKSEAATDASGSVTASSSAALSEKMILAALGDGMAVPSGLAEALQTSKAPSSAAGGKAKEKAAAAAVKSGETNSTAVAPLAQEEVPAELEAVLPLQSDMERETAYRAIKMVHDEHLSKWSSYLQPDRPAPSPFMFQRLVVLTSTISSNTRRPCTGPTLKTIEHYGANDEPLGRHLERLCAESGMICGAKGCGRPKGVQHFSVYVHNDVRVLIVQERFVCPIPGQEGRLLMWNYCKVCEQASPVVPVSPETLCLSFAKYLEGHFYPTAKTTPCQHDYHRDHVRFFALQNLAIRFHTDPVDVREVIVPQQRLVVWPDTDATLKRDEACTLAKRMRRYFESVLARLAALRTETYVCRDSATAASQAANVDAASQRAQGEWRTLLGVLVELVATTAPTDVLALNSIRRRVQEAVVRWDRDFVDLEKAILPPERDMRRLTASHLSRLFAESSTGERGSDSAQLPPASEVDEAGSTSEKGGDGTGPCDSASASAAASGTAAPLTSEQATMATPAADGGSTIKARSPGSGNDAPLIPASFSSRSDISATADGLSSPAAWRQRRLTQSSVAMAGASGVEDSSCTETDVEAANLVSRLVRRFDSPQRMTPAKAAAIHSPPALPRPQSPGLRHALPPPSPRQPQQAQLQAQRNPAQAQTGPKPSQSKVPVRPPMKRITSDGGVDSRIPADSAAMSTADEREGILSDDETRKKSILSSGGESTKSVIRRLRVGPRQSNPPTTATTLTSGGPSQGSRLAPPRPGLRRGPPSSYRPPRLSESEADSLSQSRSRHGSVSSISRGTANRPGSESEDKGSGSGVRRGTLRKTPSSSRLRGGKAPAVPSASGARPKVSTIAKHFDRIHRDAEREREKQRQLMAIRARRAQPIASARAKVEVFSSVREAVKDDDEDDEEDEEESAVEAGKTSSGDEAEDEADSDAERAAVVCAASQDSRTDAPLVSAGAGGTQALTSAEVCKDIQQVRSGAATPMEARRGASNAAEATRSAISSTLSSSWRSSLVPEVEGSERGSLLKALSSLWGRGRALPLLEYPQGANEHLFADSRVVLREDEPSSLIAFTLSSSAYQHRLDSLRAAHAKIEERLEEFQPADPDSSTLSSWDVVDVSETAALESALRRPEGTHLRFDFESGGSRFNIRTLYTEQFDALRRAGGCEQSFVTSLSRCVRWDSSGGKSGAAFLKTKDDRLVIKQLSRAEMEAFSSNASSYFRYMAESIFAGRPSTLAKIFGCYRIYIRNAQSGKTIKMDCIVMEHLFYGRRMSRLFDLKGSLRNRHIRETGRADEVLQDENLVEMSGMKPLFVREHSKRLLRAALWNDSLFLAEMNVMDYSLVVGLDADRDEMVVGIIDYIRPFDLTKRAESWLKEAVGGGQEPTIITPSAYRSRFLNFMDAIICLSPSPWLDPQWHTGPILVAQVGKEGARDQMAPAPLL